MTYTHDVQYVHFNWDQIEDRGPVDASGAVEAFRTFPFKAQQREARNLEAPTFPTVAYRSKEDGAVLSVWSLEPDSYELYMEVDGQKVTVALDDTAPIEDAIHAFFAGQRRDLFGRLARRKGATAKRGVLGWARRVFGRSCRGGMPNPALNPTGSSVPGLTC